MTMLLDAEPLLLEDADEATPCGFVLCEDRATWSTIWTCGEVITYCESHLRWAQRQDGVACVCVEIPRTVYIVMVVPL